MRDEFGYRDGLHLKIPKGSCTKGSSRYVYSSLSESKAIDQYKYNLKDKNHNRKANSAHNFMSRAIQSERLEIWGPHQYGKTKVYIDTQQFTIIMQVKIDRDRDEDRVTCVPQARGITVDHNN